MIYIFDEAADIARFLGHCAGRGVKKIFLCPITTDEDIISDAFTGLSQSGEYRVEILPFLKYFDETAFSERENFIKFVSFLGERSVSAGENIKKYFRYPGSGFSAWWLSSIVEKDPLKSDSYHNLIRLLTVLRLIEERGEKNVTLDTAFEKFSRAMMDNAKCMGFNCLDFNNLKGRPEAVELTVNLLKGVKLYIRLIFKVFILRFYMRGLEFRKKVLQNARYAAITYFPLVDREALKQRKFIDRYYNSLQAALENKHKDEFVWFAMDSDIGNFNFKDRVKLGRALNNWGYPLYFIEEWIGVRGFYSIFAHYARFMRRFAGKLRYFRQNTVYSDKRIDIWQILKEDWFSSFFGSTLMSGIIYHEAFKNIVKGFRTETAVTYLAENKAWERALNYALSEEKKARSLAIVHTSVPLLVLEFFNHPDEIRKGAQEEFSMPNPDFLACNGRIPLELFKKSGWDDDRAFLWFAIRYQHLKEHLKNNIPWQTRRNDIVVALSYSATESGELLRYVYQALRGIKGVRVTIKGHYALSMEALVKKLGLDFAGENIIFSDEPMEKLLPYAKAMIVTGSSASLDSIAFGCPVVIPKLSSVVDMNPLSGTGNFHTYAWSPKELRNIIVDIIAKKEPLFHYDKGKKFVEDYFEFFDSRDDLMEKIEDRLTAYGGLS